MKNNYIFVYGTLMKNNRSHYLIFPYCQFIGIGSIKAKLLQLSGYTGAIQDDKNEIFGEVYQFSNELMFDKLDQYEGCSKNDPHPQEFYRKIKITIASRIR